MKRVTITFCLLIIAYSLSAQTRLSLEESRRLALENSEAMQIAQMQIEKADAERAAVKTNYLPALSGNAMGLWMNKDIEQELYMPTAVPNPITGELVPNVMTHPVTGEVVVGPDGNPVFNMYAWMPLAISLKGAYLAGISLEQPIYTGGKINASNQMTRIATEMAMENLEWTRANTLSETDQTYWLYVSVQEKVKLAESYTLLLETLEEQVRHAFETGMTTQNELLKVRVKHNEARLQLQKARSGRELTRMALCRVIGLPFDTPIITIDSVLDRTLNPTAEPGLADLSNRPEYRLLLKNMELAEQHLKIVRADFLPTAGISLGFNHIGGIEISETAYNSSNASLIGSLKVPIFHWGEGRQKQLSAQKDLEIRKAELEKNEKLITLEMEQARLNLFDAMTRVEMAREALLQAEENLRVENDNHELGMGILTDLLEAQAQWQNARSELIEAGAEMKLKETAWLKASGNLK